MQSQSRLGTLRRIGARRYKQCLPSESLQHWNIPWKHKRCQLRSHRSKIHLNGLLGWSHWLVANTWLIGIFPNTSIKCLDFVCFFRWNKWRVTLFDDMKLRRNLNFIWKMLIEILWMSQIKFWNVKLIFDFGKLKLWDRSLKLVFSYFICTLKRHRLILKTPSKFLYF